MINNKSETNGQCMAVNGVNRNYSKKEALDDLFYMEGLFPKISRTFDFTLKAGMRDNLLIENELVDASIIMRRFEDKGAEEEFNRRYHGAWEDRFDEMKGYLQPYLSAMLKYGGYRIVDTIDDVPHQIDGKDKAYFMNKAIEALKRSKKDSAESIAVLFSNSSIVVHPGYRELMQNFPLLVRTFSFLRPEFKESFNRWSSEMAEGFADSRVQDIRTLEDHVEYCHYAAGVVGFDMTEDLVNLGNLTDEEGRVLMPNPESRELGVNPAHDFGVGLQLINDLKDYHEDASAGIRRWPSNLFKSENITYTDLDCFPVSPENRGKGHEILIQQLNHARPYLLAGNKWLEALPQTPVAFRIAWGDALAFSTATWRVLNEEGRDYFTEEAEHKVGRKEIEQIHKTVTGLAYQKKPIAPFVEHLMDKSADKYSIE